MIGAESPADEKPPATLVAGKYRLTRLLGRGGMGSVWEGVHETLGNRVACKFIDPEFVTSADAITRFENEARAAASLKSKHVVGVYDHGVMDDGRPYIVMEFLEGEPLDARIKKLGTLPLQATATIIRQVSLALARAHRAGIIHRDLKPENIFLVWDEDDQTDIAKVVDFGIAKFTDAGSTAISSSTKTGSILGSPYYMSPEQARGYRNLDPRSDIWSLGVIVYEALTGSRPYEGEAVGDLLVKICTTDAVPPSHRNMQLPPIVDKWMAKALHRKREARFQDVREMAEALITLSGLPERRTIGSLAMEKPDFATGITHLTDEDFETLERSAVVKPFLPFAKWGHWPPKLPAKPKRLALGGIALALVALLLGLLIFNGGKDDEVVSKAVREGIMREARNSHLSKNDQDVAVESPQTRSLEKEREKEKTTQRTGGQQGPLEPQEEGIETGGKKTSKPRESTLKRRRSGGDSTAGAPLPPKKTSKPSNTGSSKTPPSVPSSGRIDVGY